MKVNEIFSSIDGEGIRTGYPVTFVRLFGCNLTCSYCDTMYAIQGDDYRDMTLEEVMAIVEEKGLRRITLTGGEPLLEVNDAKAILERLLADGYEVNVETNGAVTLEPFEYLRKQYCNQLIYTLDYKSISSGMNPTMILENFQYIKPWDVIKFVVSNREDLDDMKRIVREVLPPTCEAELYVSPTFGDIDGKEIVQYLLDEKLEEVRMQLQMHKYIWDPQERGV